MSRMSRSSAMQTFAEAAAALEARSHVQQKPPYLVATGKAVIGAGMICDTHSRSYNIIEQGV